MLKKMTLLIGLMASILFSLTARAAEYPSDPYVLVDTAAKQTFARLKADQNQIKQQPDHLRVIIREELLPYIDNRFAAYKVLGNQIKQTTPAQRDAFVNVFTEYMVSSYADALAHFDKQVVKVEPGKPATGNITVVSVSVKESGKPDIFLEFKLRKNNKTGEWKAFDMVAEGISLLSAKQSELGGLIRQNGIDAVIAQLQAHNAKPLVIKS
ncbi:phospholipid-binding protein MlaC [Aeromonas bivalvium]|uniref:phospholipid-binding protein MlaC n=1 Tax=Aeromonas bivalvium TaxID=440079 RepID=UPI0038CFA9B7